MHAYAYMYVQVRICTFMHLHIYMYVCLCPHVCLHVHPSDAALGIAPSSCSLEFPPLGQVLVEAFVVDEGRAI